MNPLHPKFMQGIFLIGFGFIGKMHADILGKLNDAKIAGIVDSPSDELTAEIRERGLEEIPVFADIAAATVGLEFSAVDILIHNTSRAMDAIFKL